MLPSLVKTNNDPDEKEVEELSSVYAQLAWKRAQNKYAFRLLGDALQKFQQEIPRFNSRKKCAE